MKTLAASILVIGLSTFLSSSDHHQILVPIRIRTCLESPRLKAYKIDSRVNPYYLRGDFDGDNKPDLAVMIVGRRNNGPTGLAICQGNGATFVLGAGTEPKFSTKQGDDFLSSNWEVLTHDEFHKFLSDSRLGERAKGEVIALNWEDGTGYIYWDGNQYQWTEDPPS